MRHQRVSAVTGLHTCIEYENIHKIEIKEESICLEATAEVAATAPVRTMSNGESEIGKFLQGDIDIEKEKRKKYNCEYYKRRKEKNKMRKSANGEVAEVDMDIEKERRKEYNREYYARKKKNCMMEFVNGEGNSQFITLPANITASEMARLERLQDRRIHFYSLCPNNGEIRNLSEKKETTTSFDTNELNTEKTPIIVDEVAQRRKICNRNYYLRSKEKKKMKTSINKQGSTSSTKTIEVLSVTGKERIAQIMFEVGT